MPDGERDVPVGHVMTGIEYLALQKEATSHLAFSLTRACPLQCRHCMVDTVKPGRSGALSLEAERTSAYAAEMPALAAAGVKRISFTGGEPLLAARVLRSLSDAAAAAGIGCTVVTACHWAPSPQAAARTVERYPGIERWHLSTDVWHEEFVSADRVLNASTAALGAGREVVVRMAAGVPPTAADRRLYDRLIASLPSSVGISVQPVVKTGRAADLDDVEIASGTSRTLPCPTTGPVVHENGAVSPCCSSLSYEADRGPFGLPPTDDGGVTHSYLAWLEHPLVRLVRSVGFAPILKWVEAEMPSHPAVTLEADHPCDTCVALWRQPGTADVVAARLRDPSVAAKISELYEAVFGPAEPVQTGVA